MWLSILDSVVQNVLLFVKSKVKICTFFERNFNKIYRGKRVLNRWTFMLRDTCSFSQLRKGSQEERRGDYPPLPLDDWLRRLTYTYQMKYASLCKI